MKRALFLFLAGLLALTSGAAVVGREVTYTAGETTMKGFLAYDDAAKSARPGILVVHEWWGHTPYARKRATMLAELGYVALAVDMYGDGKTAAHPDDAGKFAGEVRKNMPVGEARFRAARKLLAEQPQTDASKVAAIGYCFGGSVVLHMARVGEPLAGVVSFHGSLGTETPAKADAVKARVLVCTGEDDVMIPAEQVKAFETEMTDAHAKFRIVSYKGAKHSFTNPDADKFGQEFKIPLAYNADADQASWDDMKRFLREAFAVQP